MSRVNYELNKPIFIIGAARSGTTMLGEIMENHPDLAYWLEPKYIWKYGNPNTKSDVRYGNEVTPDIRNYIVNKFGKHLKKNRKKRFLDKTPSNTFRVGFIHKIFPDAMFVNIIRNGNDVTLSAEKKWTSPPDQTALWRRLTSNEIPLKDLFYYGSAFIRDVVARTFFPSKGYIWGPSYPGMSEYRKKHSILESCAMQWKESLRYSSSDFIKIPQKQKYTVRYEELIETPSVAISNILDFLELEHYDLPDIANKHVVKTRKENYSESEIKKLGIINPIIKEMQKTLGYE